MVSFRNVKYIYIIIQLAIAIALMIIKNICKSSAHYICVGIYIRIY